MKKPTSPLRIGIGIFSLLLALISYFIITQTFEPSLLRSIRLTQVFGGLGALFLYATLFISPLFSVFPNFPWRAPLMKSKKALGLSAFFFAFMHVYISFFTLLGGFEGWGFLSGKFLFATISGVTAFMILTVLAITSTTWAKRMLGKYWKTLQRSVYAVGFIVLVHVLMIGTHFNDVSQAIPLISLYSVLLLLILEVLRFNTYLQMKFPAMPRLRHSVVVCILLIVVLIVIKFVPADLLSIHGLHVTQ